MIYNIDALIGLKQLAPESIDCCVSDVPYRIASGGEKNIIENLTQSGCGGMLARSKRANIVAKRNKGIMHEALNNETGKIFQYNNIKSSEYLPLIYRVMKERTHTYIMINARNLAEMITEGEKAGFILQNLLVWNKDTQTPNKFYMNKCEFIVMFRKGNERWINDMGMSNIFNDKTVKERKHPTEKPVSLMEKLISQSTNTGDIVLDPFAGCGSTLIAAKNLNCQFIGFEIDEKYFKIAERRINGN